MYGTHIQSFEISDSIFAGAMIYVTAHGEYWALYTFPLSGAVPVSMLPLDWDRVN